MGRNKNKAKAAETQDQQNSSASTASSASSPPSSSPTTAAASATAQQVPTAPSQPFETLLITRSKNEGMVFRSLKPSEKDGNPTPVEFAPSIAGNFRDCESVVSPCKTMIAFADEKFVYVHSLSEAKAPQVFKSDAAPKSLYLSWSPLSTFLVCFAHHDAKSSQNMVVLNIKTKTKALATGQAFWPALLWAADESIVVRRSQSQVIACKGDLSDQKPLSTLSISLSNNSSSSSSSSAASLGKESALAVSPSSRGPPFIACFVPQVKQNVATAHSFRINDLTTSVFAKPIGRGDRATLKFSPGGSVYSALVSCDEARSTVSTMTTSTGASASSSYYGATAFHVIDISSRTSTQMPLIEGESVYHSEWNPAKDSELIVVHGIMPRNRATIFNSKLEKIWSFAEAPRNKVFFGPGGTSLALGGSGSLSGEFTIHDMSAVGLANKDGKLSGYENKTSHQAWLPDGRHFSCYNLFSTLRVDQKLVIYKYNGEKIYEEKLAQADELRAVHWVPAPASASASALKYEHTRGYKSPVRDSSRLHQKAEAWKPRHQSAAATALLNASAATGSSAVGAIPTGKPVGATVLAPTKKRR